MDLHRKIADEYVKKVEAAIIKALLQKGYGFDSIHERENFARHRMKIVYRNGINHVYVDGAIHIFSYRVSPSTELFD